MTIDDLCVMPATALLSPFYLEKQLVEQLVLSKLDHGDVVFNPLPDYFLKRLQKNPVFISQLLLITGKYVNSVESVLKLGWLPMSKRRDSS